MVLFNSDLFDPNNISPETERLNRDVKETLDSLPPTYTLPPQKIRDDREAGKGLWPAKRLDTLEDRLVSTSAGEVPIRVYIPREVKGVYLHFHGGGFTLGRAHHQDVPLVQLAEQCRVATVSVDYRLAPENPYPAAPDDGEGCALWLMENARKEFGTELLLIGGESAGANLSVVTLLRMRDKHGFKGFSCANLVYGVYDLAMTPSAKNWGEENNLVLTTKLMEWFHINYVPLEKQRDPDVSPIYADLSGLPPALFTVGTLDPLLDDSLFMHARWGAAGNRSRLEIYPGGIHAFTAFPIEMARQAKSRCMDFISEILSD